MALLSWLQQTFLKLQAAANLSEDNLETGEDLQGCQIFADALDEKGRQLDRLVEDISILLDEFWRCRERQLTAESLGTEDQSFQRWQIAAANKNGAQNLLKTSASRVRQVVREIDLIGRTGQ